MAPKPPAKPPAKAAQEPTFFETPAAFRRWLEVNHRSIPELLVGFYKKDTGRPSITWPESVDQALCFGWIDGIRRSLGVMAYTIRFTPRRKRSIWSAVNSARMKELIAQKLVAPAGLAAYEARMPNRSGIYAYEQRPENLPEQYSRVLRKHPKAWEFFESLSPYRRRTLTWWIVSGRQEATRLRRLDQLIRKSARGQAVGQLEPGKRPARKR